MATITLDYDAKNTMAQRTVEYVLSTGLFKAKTKNRVDIAIDELSKGKTYKCKDFDDYLKKIK